MSTAMLSTILNCFHTSPIGEIYTSTVWIRKRYDAKFKLAKLSIIQHNNYQLKYMPSVSWQTCFNESYGVPPFFSNINFKTIKWCFSSSKSADCIMKLYLVISSVQSLVFLILNYLLIELVETTCLLFQEGHINVFFPQKGTFLWQYCVSSNNFMML